MSVTQLGYMGLSVRDITAWERFATEVLGMPVSERGKDGSLYLRMDERHYRFIVHPTGSDDLAYLGWEVAGPNDLAALADKLRAAGISVRNATEDERAERKVCGLIKLSDPNGLDTEIYWGPQVDFDRPFAPSRPISGFVTGSQGAGHLVMMVSDVEASRHFYCDLLGMHVSDYIVMDPSRLPIPLPPDIRRVELTFLHVNGRHHTLAFGNMGWRPGMKRLHHIMVQVKSLDDVGLTQDLAEDQGLLRIRLGRHTNDHMVSFYMETPSGFQVEYGYGAREVDEATWQIVTHTSTQIWGHRPVAATQPAPQPARVTR